MRTARSTAAVIGGLVFAMLITGCVNPDQDQIQTLQQKVIDLQRENDGLRSRLSQAISERDAAMARAGALRQQVNDLQRELANVQPAETTPGGWQQAGEWRWIDLGSDLLFDSGKATLKPAGVAKLQEVVRDIQANFPDMMVWVIGHTDSDPIRVTKNLYQDNLDLSVTRGASVYRELVKLGISPDRLIAGGQGEYVPVASNQTKDGKTMNRRVQVVAVPRAEAAAAGVRAAMPVEREAPPRMPESVNEK